MLTFSNNTVAAIGEAMVEMAPVGDGLYAKGFAGDTFNTAWHMAQLLGQDGKVGYVSRVGQDDLSESFVQELLADGMDVAGIARDPDRSMGLYLIELDGVERRFHYWRSVSAARALADDAGQLRQAVGQAGLIHLSGITLAILQPAARETLFDVLTTARSKGAVVCFDPNIRPRLWSGLADIRATMARMLAITDIALPSFDDERTHWGDPTPLATIARFAALGVREVVVKNADLPVEYLSDDQRGLVPTPSVSAIKDTTGAGDAFNAGYLAARLLGQPVKSAIGLGQFLAGEVICCFGARAPKARVAELGISWR